VNEKKYFLNFVKETFLITFQEGPLTFVTMFERMFNHNYKKEKVFTSNFNERNGLLGVRAINIIDLGLERSPIFYLG
jgi:hypothetical protein